MKKLTAFVICLLLIVSVLSIQVFAAESAAEPTISLVEDKSFVEIDGKEIPVNELEAAGYKLVLTPVLWNSEYFETAAEELKTAYAELQKQIAADQVKGVDKNLVISEFFQVSVVNVNDENEVVESANVTLTISMPDAAKVNQVVNKLNDDTDWTVVENTVTLGNDKDEETTITVTAGGTGLYAFLVSQELPEAGDDFVPSIEQTVPSL